MTENLTTVVDTPTELKSELIGDVHELKSELYPELPEEGFLTEDVLTPACFVEVVNSTPPEVKSKDTLNITAKELAEKLKVDYPHMAGMVKVLEKLGIARTLGKVKGTKAVLWQLPTKIAFTIE